MFPLLPTALVFVAGIITGNAFHVPFAAWILAMGTTLAAAFLLKQKAAMQYVAVLLTAFFLGSALVTRSNQQLRPPLTTGKPVAYHAVIIGKPMIHGRIAACDMALYKAEGFSLPRPVLVKAAFLRDTLQNRWRALQTGMHIEACSVMEPPPAYQPGRRFNYEQWMRVHGFAARTFILPRSWQISANHDVSLPRLLRLRLKATLLRERLLALSGPSQPYDQRYAVIAAMTLGDKTWLSKQTHDNFNISGGAHVLALSGLHLGIIYAMLSLLFPLAGRRKWLKQAFVLVAIWAYTFMAGMGTSVTRAAVMLSVLSVGAVLGRGKASLNTLSLAVIVMLMVSPLSLWDVGFQLSFTAVLGILLFYPFLSGIIFIKQKLLRMIWNMAAVSLAAQLTTAPLVMYYFGRFPCYFLFTNMVAVPAATVIVYGAVIWLFTMPLPVIGKMVASTLLAVAGGMNYLLMLIASLPGASIENININTAQVAGMYVIIAAVAMLVFYYRHIQSVKKLDCFNKKPVKL